MLAWLEVNKTKAAIVAVVLVLIGFAIATMRYLRDEKEGKASAELLALKLTLAPQTNVVPAQPSAILKVAEDYPGTSAAERARLLAATAEFTSGKYADAERAFSQFVKDNPGSPWVAEAAFGVASAQEAQNKLNEAQASYQNVATAYASSAVAERAKLSLARIYEERKQPDQALRIYNELLAPRAGAQPGEMGNRDAFQRKEALLRDHPELNANVPPPAPSAAPSAASAATNAPAVPSKAPAAASSAPQVKTVPVTKPAPAPAPVSKPVPANTPPAK